jgi:hypothetical protein
MQPSAAGDARPTAAVVTLDVFSGQPNPHWTLGQEELATLLGRLDKLAPWQGRPPGVPGLGYRGIETVLRGGASGEVTLTVARGVVRRASAVGADTLADPGRGLERWLFATGAAHLPPPVMAYVSREIDAQP